MGLKSEFEFMVIPIDPQMVLILPLLTDSPRGCMPPLIVPAALAPCTQRSKVPSEKAQRGLRGGYLFPRRKHFVVSPQLKYMLVAISLLHMKVHTRSNVLQNFIVLSCSLYASFQL